MLTSLSVVLPAYNEEENIETAVGRCIEALPAIAERYEVIVVDDGSRDRTAEITADLAAAHPGNVRLLRHRRNLGYGAAIANGFNAARGDYLFYTDADNQFDVSELAWFAPLMQEVDAVVGFRVYRYDTALRSIVSWCYNRLVNVLFRVRVRDVDCAFKLFRREVIEKIDVESRDFFIDTELVARTRKWNFRIVEKGVRHYPRTAGETTVKVSDVPRTLKTVCRMWQRIYYPRRADTELLRARREEIAAWVYEETPTSVVAI
ncbi:MAG TPA: glycosyltransferase family 2 protein [Conexibacter sp.]|jgi:dolichol-phosphate mannosyltransferase